MSHISAAIREMKEERKQAQTKVAYAQDGVNFWQSEIALWQSRVELVDHSIANLIALQEGKKTSAIVSRTSKPAARKPVRAAKKGLTAPPKITAKLPKLQPAKMLKVSGLVKKTDSPKKGLPKTGTDFWLQLLSDQPQPKAAIFKAAVDGLGFKPSKALLKKLDGRMTFHLHSLHNKSQIETTGNGRERAYFKRVDAPAS